MAVDILNDHHQGQAVLFCNTSDWAFGPVFSEGQTDDARALALDFLDWLPMDPRDLSESELEGHYHRWLSERVNDEGDLIVPERWECPECGEQMSGLDETCSGNFRDWDHPLNLRPEKVS